jgi:hypothetical protein
MVKFWMVYVEGSRGCSRKHDTRQSAIDEAERLLRLPDNAGRNVFLLESMGYVHFEPLPVKWEMIKDDVEL